MIFQDPQASLNERAKVDYIISEGLMNIEKGSARRNGRNRWTRPSSMWVCCRSLPAGSPRVFRRSAAENRIARALIMNPEFIIADELISHLTSVRAQVLNLLADMQKKRGITYLFIAHDLSVMRFITDRIAVIRKGRSWKWLRRRN